MNITVTPQQTIPLTLSLNANGGTLSSTSISVAKGGAVGTLPTPTRTGYKFTGWNIGTTTIDATYILNA
ncbi:MAG: InlB B-repeat-containing protein, partial [Bacteroidales bacterium]|nr:InlB B-repeat-containing protein [Bacteroidales bacterium]